MLELTGKCCSGIEAIEFMENLKEIIPEDKKQRYSVNYLKML